MISIFGSLSLSLGLGMAAICISLFSLFLNNNEDFKLMDASKIVDKRIVKNTMLRLCVALRKCSKKQVSFPFIKHSKIIVIDQGKCIRTDRFHMVQTPGEIFGRDYKNKQLQGDTRAYKKICLVGIRFSRFRCI